MRQRGERRLTDVASELGGTWSDSKLSKIENGRTAISVQDVRKLLRVYGTRQPAFDEIIRLTRHAQQVSYADDYKEALPRDFGSFAELEYDAVSISSYDETLIPGLLQTEAYALEILRAGQFQDSEDEIAQRFEARMTRREILQRSEPPRLAYVLSETTLRMPVGGPQTMHDQLRHLATLAQYANLALNVVPLGSGPHAASGFPFMIFTMPDDLAEVVYSEQFCGSKYDEDPQIVTRYRLAFNTARAQALGAADSLALIERIMKE